MCTAPAIFDLPSFLASVCTCLRQCWGDTGSYGFDFSSIGDEIRHAVKNEAVVRPVDAADIVTDNQVLSSHPMRWLCGLLSTAQDITHTHSAYPPLLPFPGF